MTFGEMLVLTKRFQSITDAKTTKFERNTRLATLMTDLEHAYGIPMFADDERLKQVNPFALQLYRTVSFARVF